MFDAAGEGDLERVRQLLDEGALVLARNRFGNTALIYAARATAGVVPPVQAVGDL
ncbi:MAG: ankyrin repeat domain-containing protein [Gammaproteobacteria bacterium]|nr:ankyrin repeat domain-containing protein [Gammaproteobacteria bacterium]